MEEQTLEISGSLTVRRAQELGEIIRGALTGAPSLTLDLSKATDADLSFVQIVESARLSAARAGARLSLSGPASGGLLSVLDRGGLLGPACPERTAFWTGTETCR
jgi:anti-anti-sigma regulatory factor